MTTTSNPAAAPTARTRIRVGRIAGALAMSCLVLVGVAAPAGAGRWSPNVATPAMMQGLSCGTNGQVSVALTHDPVTRSGNPGWSYSLFYAGDRQNPWVVSNWTIVWANTGYQQTWEWVNGAWTRPVAGSVDVSVPPYYRSTEVWELRYELVGGRWTTEWIKLGTCTPPPGA